VPLVRCSHCGEDTFTIAGWADLDHCASCGRALGTRPIELDAPRRARSRRRFDDSAQRPESAGEQGVRERVLTGVRVDDEHVHDDEPMPLPGHPHPGAPVEHYP
jgi:hypothetical protein